MYRKQIDDTMPPSLKQWGRSSPNSGGNWAYQHWTLELIYNITRLLILKTGKVVYVASVCPRRHAFGAQPVDNYQHHKKASDAAGACVKHFQEYLRRGSLSGTTMPTKKTSARRTTRASSSRPKARKSPKSTTKRKGLGSTATSTRSTKAAATKRVTAISHEAQKLYRAPGNKKSWQTCIKQASAKLF